MLIISASLVASVLMAKAAVASDFTLGAVPQAIASIKTSNDPIALSASTIPNTQVIPGSDHVFLDLARNRILIFGMDQYIYSVKLDETYQVAIVGHTPIVVGGIRIDPRNPNKILFAGSKMQGRAYSNADFNGIYEAELSSPTIQVSPVLTRVFKDTPATRAAGTYFSRLQAESMTTPIPVDNPKSRPIGICDDLVITEDGRRVYFVEPYAQSGGGYGDEITGTMNQAEILKASQDGKLWLWDRDTSELKLIGTGLAFPDGIALAPKQAQKEADVLLLTELSRYRLNRLIIGLEQTEVKVLYNNLPGMPNAMEVDNRGRIYMALNKMRTWMIDEMEDVAYFKTDVQDIALSLPQWLKPVPKQTGYLVLEEKSVDDYQPIYFTEHSGSVLTSITNVVPDIDHRRLYFALFDSRYHGVYAIPMPAVLQP